MAESSQRSSRGSVSSGGGGGGADVVVSGSPVPYRLGPLEYQPPKFCRCNVKKKAPRLISWSVVDNPGRRYYRCIDAKNKHLDCGYFEWFDPPTSDEWMKELLLDLKAEVFKLKRERGQPVVDEARELHFQEVEELHQSLQRQLMHFQEVEELNQSLQRQLVKMDAKLEANQNGLEKKEEELVTKDAELIMKQQELDAKQKQLDALELKMKGMKNGCSTYCGFMCLFVVGLLVALVLYGRCN